MKYRIRKKSEIYCPRYRDIEFKLIDGEFVEKYDVMAMDPGSMENRLHFPVRGFNDCFEPVPEPKLDNKLFVELMNKCTWNDILRMMKENPPEVEKKPIHIRGDFNRRGGGVVWTDNPLGQYLIFVGPDGPEIEEVYKPGHRKYEEPNMRKIRFNEMVDELKDYYAKVHLEEELFTYEATLARTAGKVRKMFVEACGIEGAEQKVDKLKWRDEYVIRVFRLPPSRYTCGTDPYKEEYSHEAHDEHIKHFEDTLLLKEYQDLVMDADIKGLIVNTEKCLNISTVELSKRNKSLLTVNSVDGFLGAWKETVKYLIEKGLKSL